jgi:hypothetical protein
MIMDFDRGEMRIPRDVALALDMPVDFSCLVHRGNRQMLISRNIDPTITAAEKRRGRKPHKSPIDRYWREDADAYCMTVVSGMQQIIGNLIAGFNGSGVYVLTGSIEQAFGEPVIVFDLGHAAVYCPA